MLDNVIAFIESSIPQLDVYEFWLPVAIFSVATLAAFIKMVQWWKRSRMLADVPTSKIRSASQGYVELVGKAMTMKGPIIASPLSGKRCVWYRYKIEERSSNHNMKSRSNHWSVVKEAVSDAIFLLEDETGRCVIDPDDADVIVRDKRTWYKHNVTPTRRYTEELITDYEPLYAIGLFNTIANVGIKQQRDQVSYLLREWKNDPNRLLHEFDTDRNGQIDQQEWEQARLAAERQIKREYGQQEKLTQLNILKNTEHSDQNFIISTISENTLIQRYRRHALLSLLAFFSLGSLIVWAINIRLGQ